MGSYITCVDLYPPNGMFWLKTDKRCPSCFEGSYICAESPTYIPFQLPGCLSFVKGLGFCSTISGNLC